MFARITSYSTLRYLSSAHLFGARSNVRAVILDNMRSQLFTKHVPEFPQCHTLWFGARCGDHFIYQYCNSCLDESLLPELREVWWTSPASEAEYLIREWNKRGVKVRVPLSLHRNDAYEGCDVLTPAIMLQLTSSLSEPLHV